MNALWFTVVTITTVGYGDMVPKNLIARVITGGLMLVGIGILGLLTATLLKKLLMGGQVRVAKNQSGRPIDVVPIGDGRSGKKEATNATEAGHVEVQFSEDVHGV